jgi:hypothetical protein
VKMKEKFNAKAQRHRNFDRSLLCGLCGLASLR